MFCVATVARIGSPQAHGAHTTLSLIGLKRMIGTAPGLEMNGTARPALAIVAQACS